MNTNLSTRGIQFSSEYDRLETFRNWPHSDEPFPLDLVKAGFYFKGYGDTVTCAFCNGEINNWRKGKDPVAEHNRLFPNCFYIQEYVRRMLYMMSSSIMCFGRSAEQPTVTSTVRVSPSRTTTTTTKNSSTHRLNNLSSVSVDYTKEENRLKSYVGWKGKVNTGELARAGLYYLGTSDRVKCFSCNAVFRDWEFGDDPWIEHAKWHPDCKYLKLCLGEGVVLEIHRNVSRRSDHIATENFGDIVEGPSLSLVY